MDTTGIKLMVDKNQALKQLFVILDRFNRDALHRQCGKKLDFIEDANLFCSTLNTIKDQKDLTLEMEFSDYKEEIEDGKPPHLQENFFKSANVKSTLLFFAVSQPIPQDVIERNCLKTIIEALLKKCPDAVNFPWDIERYDPTPLHLMVVKEANSRLEKEFKYEILQAMLATRRWNYLMDVNDLSPEMSRGPITSGKSLLNIAARTLDIQTISLLLKKCVSFLSCNVQGDNMYHSLIQYASICPEKESKIKSTMISIAAFLCEKQKELFFNLDVEKRILKLYPDYLWMMTNKEGLTPLQLAAKLGRFELFEFISKQKIYKINDGDRGSLDDVAYDVTEIDTVPVTGAKNKYNSVLHLLHHLPSDTLTLRFVGLNVVGKTISAKWESYKLGYLIWAILHFVMMFLYSWHAIIRSRLENPVSKSIWPNFNDVTFVIISGTITTIYAILCVLSQCIVGIRYKLKHKGIRYFWEHRGEVVYLTYGHIILILGVCMIVDNVFMFTTSTYENFVLPFAVIIGWYFMIYFLRVVERFSFFTVLIANVAAHLIQFGIVMLLLLIGFSVAMFVAMQGAEENSENSFHHIGKTFLKMFTVMVGIGEIDVLSNVRNPALAVIVFVVFVLLTPILLLNALIAIMSNTCSKFTTPTSSKAYVRLQKLHAIINLEAMLCNRFLSPATEEIPSIRPPAYFESQCLIPPEECLRSIPRRILWIRPDDDKQSTSYSLENEASPSTVTIGLNEISQTQA